MQTPELNRSPDSRVDVEQLHLGRLARLRDELRSRDCAAGLFYDPMNIRYATGTSNMQVYSLHNPCRYAFVATEGPVVMFDFKGCAHLSEGCPAVDEVRDAISWYHFVTGQHVEREVEQWAASLAELLAEVGGGNRRIAVDRLDPPGMAALARRQITVIDGQEPASMARMIKTDPELLAIQEAVDVCEAGIRAMDEARRPGITEQALWSILHQINIERGGEWIETRLLSSGPRTNPWYQEAGARRIEDGDIVSFDTDLVGPHGYSADISRSWLVGDRRATDAQRRQYALAHEQVSRNVELFKAGVSYRELAERAFSLPEPYDEYQIGAVAHGIGLCNEYPLLLHRSRYETAGDEGVLHENMVVCVESYVGAPGGREGIKLEQQVLVTADGPKLMSSYPFEEALL